MKLKKAGNWFLVLFWMAVIFTLSHLSGNPLRTFKEWEFVLRKMAHVTEYIILTLLLVRALREYKLNGTKVVVLAAVIALLYAFSDEYHQTYILNRYGNLYDVTIDGCGILLAAWFGRKILIK